MRPQEFEQRAFHVFNRTLAVHPDERATLLKQICGRDELLRQEVEELLRAAETKSGEGLMGSKGKTDHHFGMEMMLDQGARIGSFEILSVLGEGGMARVYLARQSSPRRRVALKVIRSGVDPDQSRQRFELEKQMLAHLNHPHIAKLFEAGVAETGEPFFVMEYIDGLPITEYCDKHRLPLADRLSLMISVCEAVQHAHQKGVIHRDLKPANVLVTVENGRPVPKIIDFGIAKVIGEHQRFFTNGDPSLTGAALIGSLAYMSPEQARVTEAQIDTRTDVYALGILLYELLVGVSPFADLDQLHSLEEVFRHIRERNPAKPSDFFRDGAEAVQAAAHLRRSDVGSLWRDLRNDLDWITLKALEKEPDRRHASPADLVRDIAAFRDNRPVSAGPPRISYRLKKFVWRNRILVALSLTVLCSLVAGLVGTLYNLNLARGETARQQKTLALLQELITSPDPLVQGPDTRVRDLLDGFSEKLTTRLQDEPEILATLNFTLGKTYSSLSLYPQAHQHADQALTLRRSALGETHENTLEAEFLLGSVLNDMGRFEEAELSLRKTAKAARNLWGIKHISTLRIQLALGTLLMNKGQLKEAEAILCETLLLSSEEQGPFSPLTIESQYFMGVLLMQTKNHSEAETMLRETLTKQRMVSSKVNIDALNTMCYLANSLMEQQKYAEAEDLLRESCSIGIEQMGLEHRSTIYYMNSLARVLSKRGNHAEAIEMGREVVGLSEQLFGATHPTTLIIKSNLALTYNACQRWHEAETLLREVIPAYQRSFGALNPISINTKEGLVKALENQGQFEEAALHLRGISADWEQVYGADHHYTIKAKAALARVSEKLADSGLASVFDERNVDPH